MAQFWVGIASYRRDSFGALGRAAYMAGERLEAAAGLAAYRAGDQVAAHDFRRRHGVRETWLELPPGAPEWAMDRAALWQAAGRAESRRNATVVHELVASLPWEMSAEGRSAVALEIGEYLCRRYGVAVDCAIHDPPKHGDERHHHMHALCSTRRLEGEAGFTTKVRELVAFATRRQEVEAIRAKVAELINAQLKLEHIEERVDHRSVRRQALEIKAQEARQDRDRAASARDKATRMQALQQWRLEDLERRLQADPMVWDRATKVQARDRAEREIRAETATRVAAKIDMLGRQLTKREVRSIRQAIEQRRARQAKRQAPPARFWTREELQRAKAAARLEDVQALVDKPKRVAALEAQIRRQGHIVQAVAARLEAGRAVERDGTRPPATLASVRKLIQRARAAERTGMRR